MDVIGAAVEMLLGIEDGPGFGSPVVWYWAVVGGGVDPFFFCGGGLSYNSRLECGSSWLQRLRLNG